MYLEKDKKSFRSAYINLKVKGQEGNEMFFRIKRTTKLMKLMDTYHRRQAMDDYVIVFHYDGIILGEEDTPNDLKMEDGDEIAVMFYIDEDSQMKADQSSKKIHVGPWGGPGGIEWDDGSFSGITAITLRYGGCIDSIRVEYDMNGKPFLADKHGGNGGNHRTKIILNHPAEYLTLIRGHMSPFAHDGTPVIRSLVFKSNQRDFGPFGVEEGTPFTFPMEGGMIVGFSGQSGRYLDAIGLYLTSVSSTSTCQCSRSCKS